MREAASPEEVRKMTLSTAVTTCLSKYATFSGRARRAELWKFLFFVYPCIVVMYQLDKALGTTVVNPKTGADYPVSGTFTWMAAALFLLPCISVTIRRLHDRNRSGWWLLLHLIPLLGTLILLIWTTLKGTEGENDFGPDPLSLDSAAEESSAQTSAITPAPAAEEPSARTSAISQAPTAIQDVTEQLAKLGKLHAVGILTDDEFRKMKAKLIGA